MLTEPLSTLTARTMDACGVTAALDVAGGMSVISPVTGESVAQLATHSAADAEAAIARANAAFRKWRLIPGPRRASWCGSSRKSCANRKRIWAAWSRSRRANRPPKGLAKCRR